MGLVFKVDPATGDGTQIELTGPAGDFSVVNGDGIEVRGNSLAVVRNFNNEVATFKLNGQLSAGVLTDQITSDGFAIPTTATWAGRGPVGRELPLRCAEPAARPALLDHARSWALGSWAGLVRARPLEIRKTGSPHAGLSLCPAVASGTQPTTAK